MAAAKPEGQSNIRSYRIEIAAGGYNATAVGHNKSAVELRQFFHGPAQVRVRDLSQFVGMTQKRIEDKWS